VEYDVLGIDAGAQAAADVDAADLEGREGHGLCGEDVAHLAGPDPERDRTERAMGGGVGIATGDGGAGLGDALFWADDVDDALVARFDVEVGDAEVAAILAEGLDHLVGEGVGEWLVAVIGWDDVIDSGESAVGIADAEAEFAEHGERLWAGDLVDEVGTYEELGLAVGEPAHGVRLPDLFKQCLAAGAHDRSLILERRKVRQARTQSK